MLYCIGGESGGREGEREKVNVVCFRGEADVSSLSLCFPPLGHTTLKGRKRPIIQNSFATQLPGCCSLNRELYQLYLSCFLCVCETVKEKLISSFLFMDLLRLCAHASQWEGQCRKKDKNREQNRGTSASQLWEFDHSTVTLISGSWMFYRCKDYCDGRH